MMFMMVYKNAKMFMIVHKNAIKNSNSNSNNKTQANIQPSWPNMLSKEGLIFVIQYKSFDLILIKSNWFYLSHWERKPTVKALSRLDKLKYNMFW